MLSETRKDVLRLVIEFQLCFGQAVDGRLAKQCSIERALLLLTAFILTRLAGELLTPLTESDFEGRGFRPNR